MLDPIRLGLEGSLSALYGQLVPSTPQLAEFAARGLGQSIVWAPGRMVDQADELLASWRRNDATGQTTRAYELPVMLVAIAPDWTPTDGAFAPAVADAQWVIFREDPKERVFKLRQIQGEIRAQVVVFASNPATAQSLMAQLILWFSQTDGRDFRAVHRFAGFDAAHACKIHPPPDVASKIDVETKIVTALALDLTIQASIPLYSAPAVGEINDGKGDPADPADPAGYPVVTQIDSIFVEPAP